MSTFRIFLGAPSINDLDEDPIAYRWDNISSQSEDSRAQLPSPPDFPAAEILDEASRRLSRIYENVIFNEDDVVEGQQDEDVGGGGDKFIPTTPDQTTVITWPPTAEGQAQRHSRSRRSLAEISFLNTTTRSSFDETQQQFSSTQETQAAQSIDDDDDDNYTQDASSIARFPTFHFNLHSLTSLTQLAKQKTSGSVKMMMTLLAILEVEGPDIIRIKNGRDAGKEVAILKMILGDEGGTICKLTAWREVAERWGGGQRGAVGVKRGDIVLIENVTAVFNPTSSPTITASPYLKSSLIICYRTMPYSREDSRLRPDLRLGRSDAAVRKVATVVAWFQDLAGLAAQ